ncbi:DUF676 domain-containing protein [Plasmodiophora brassicae]|uniref:DUF676 domain-containing protein n=1 Tax=Plasmodiophora brassicae TaxID=37360 RepID=A0A0G4IR13_PLABS|nr:hypothetical protein PBRA_005927 [Plasmodiophora brassicae]SPQ98359.1 unnamed protein product [Plasmodiophora brassicae]
MPPTRAVHAVVMVHGLHGLADDFAYMATRLRERFRDATGISAVVLVPTVNHGLTRHGIQGAAERLAPWIVDECQKHHATHISFIGHSLGGLIARYVIRLLHDNGTIPVRVQPVIYLSIATPHLGSLEHARRARSFAPHPLTAIVDDVFMHGTRFFIKQTGEELMLKDGDDSTVPLIVRMTDDAFINALRLFRHRIAYGAIRYDPTVGYETSVIRRTNPFKAQFPVSLSKLLLGESPRVIRDDAETAEMDEGGSQTVHTPLEELMMGRLDALDWERYAILPSRPVFAHVDVIVKSKFFNERHGSVVVDDIVNRVFDLAHASS